MAGDDLVLLDSHSLWFIVVQPIPGIKLGSLKWSLFWELLHGLDVALLFSGTRARTH